MNKPNSLKEKAASPQLEEQIAHWMYVHELMGLLEKLAADDKLLPNDVYNLAIVRGESYAGYIDFRTNELDIW